MTPRTIEEALVLGLKSLPSMVKQDDAAKGLGLWVRDLLSARLRIALEGAADTDEVMRVFNILVQGSEEEK